LLHGEDPHLGGVAGHEPAVAHAGASLLAVDAEAQSPARLPAGLEPVDAMHLAERGPAQDGMLRGRLGAELGHGETREVLHGRRHVARGNKAADVPDLASLSWGAGKAAAVAAREAWIVRGDTVHDGARHAERLEDAALDVARVGQARDGGDDLA